MAFASRADGPDIRDSQRKWSMNTTPENPNPENPNGPADRPTEPLAEQPTERMAEQPTEQTAAPAAAPYVAPVADVPAGGPAAGDPAGAAPAQTTTPAKSKTPVLVACGVGIAIVAGALGFGAGYITGDETSDHPRRHAGWSHDRPMFGEHPGDGPRGHFRGGPGGDGQGRPALPGPWDGRDQNRGPRNQAPDRQGTDQQAPGQQPTTQQPTTQQQSQPS